MRLGPFALVPFVLQLVAVLPGQSVDWWQKDLAGALAAAKDKPSGLALLYCWKEKNPACESMFGGPLSDKESVAPMQEFLCMGLKQDDATQKAIIEKYRVEILPTVLFVQPDGNVVDVIQGYVPSKEFLSEVARVRAGTKTLLALRKMVAEKPDDLVTALELVHKLRKLGDKEGSIAVVDAMVAKDQKLASEEAAEGMLLKINDQIFKPGLDPKDYDLKPMREFLVKQKSKRVLFLGYDRLAAAEWKRDNLKNAIEYADRAWKNIPPELVHDWGQNVIHLVLISYKELDKVDKTLLKRALAVSEKTLKEAEKLQKATPDDAYFAYALYLHAGMLNLNGLRKDAFATIDKAIALDPKNDTWKKAKEVWVDGGK